MISLPILIALNNRPQKIRDNFNRDSSLCKSRGGFVAHSAVHRSTHFASAKEHPETYALYWWIADSKNQAAVNCAVQSIECGQTVAATWRAVLPILHPIPGLVIHGGDKVKKLSVPIRADIPSGQAVLRLSAITFAELHCKLGKVGK